MHNGDILMTPEDTLIKTAFEKYSKKSQDSEYAGYNPLFCAIYDARSQDGTLNKEVFEDIKLLLQYYVKNNQLQEIFADNNNTYGEHILHVAMRQLDVFKFFCKEVYEWNLELFYQLMIQADKEGDNILHQFVEFGRTEALNHLVTQFINTIQDVHVNNALAKARDAKNKQKESPLEIANNFDKSVTIQDLAKREIIIDIETSKKYTIEIAEVLKAFQVKNESQDEFLFQFNK